MTTAHSMSWSGTPARDSPGLRAECEAKGRDHLRSKEEGMLDQLTKDMFAQHVHTKFRVHYAPPQTAEVELIEVAERRSTPRQEQFSIVFRGPRDPFFPQKIYTFEHDRLGAFDLFIVPIGMDEGGVQYEAFFNRLRQEARAP